jgi:hypothetical protein
MVQSLVALNRASTWANNYKTALAANSASHNNPATTTVTATTVPPAPLGQITRTFSREDQKRFIERNIAYMGTAIRELLNVRKP